MDTIFATASAKGKAGVAVFRISGPRAHEAVKVLTGRVLPPRKASLCRLRWNGEDIDQGLVLCFDAGASFTGEEVAELQVHGSVAVVAALHRALGQIEGLRPAEPGEFTRRALENGQLDLAQVEGLADLIEAETEAQRKQALRVLSGAVGERAARWRTVLLRAAALVAAVIDFADEEDAPKDVTDEVARLLDDLLVELRREESGSHSAERLRDGFEVAIVGAPNAGKSTLLNGLAGRDAAITSEIAGTTRDVIEVRMDLGGLPVTFLDTAGLRESDDPVEAIGIKRALERAAAADLRVFLYEHEGEELLLAPQHGDLVVQGKADLNPAGGLSVSGRTGQGIPELIVLIEQSLSARMASAGVLTRERHRIAVRRAISALVQARSELNLREPRLELVASDIGSGIRALDSLIGRIDVESLLDEIFSSFCIGK
ncbi:MAG: tRNA uridine-5-carboxymethylaminomethyl(34) synthesis GTPase MnmE [Paracoccaceae bacterium]